MEKIIFKYAENITREYQGEHKNIMKAVDGVKLDMKTFVEETS